MDGVGKEAERRRRVCPVIEPARIGAQHHRGQGLDDPDAAQELQVDGVLRRHEEDEQEGAELDDEGHPFRHPCFLLVRRVPIDELAVDIARIEIRRRPPAAIPWNYRVYTRKWPDAKPVTPDSIRGSRRDDERERCETVALRRPKGLPPDWSSFCRRRAAENRGWIVFSCGFGLMRSLIELGRGLINEPPATV
jgi:hypothetical protein